MKRIILIFGLLIIALLALFKLSTFYWITGDLAAEWIIAALAMVFFGIGIWISKINQKKTSANAFQFNVEKQKELNISQRELEVLQALALGLSNKEIADKLFVSESTVKTHVSNLLVKLDAKRRTQAVITAQTMNLIAK